MKILLDMNLTPRWVGFLRERGHQAVRWSEVGQASASDLEVLRFAAAHAYLKLHLRLYHYPDQKPRHPPSSTRAPYTPPESRLPP